LLVASAGLLGVHLAASGWEGLPAGGRAAGRLVGVLLASMLFVRTTDPARLARSLTRLGLPYRWGFAMTTALRLVPLFRIEATQVYWAHLARGARYDLPGALRRRVRMLRGLLMPLLVSSLRTAHELAVAMENRSFGRYRRRTWLHPESFSRGDAVALALLGACLAGAVWWWLR